MTAVEPRQFLATTLATSQGGHNRWHPDITPLVECESGQTLTLETLDALDGQLDRSSSSADVGAVNMNRLHPLVGPVLVHGAKAGDLLEVEVLDVVPDTFGYTSQHVGFGLLREYFPDPFLVRWDLAEGKATSPDIPGVTVPAAPFMGVMGVAPDRQTLKAARHREGEVVAAGGLCYPPNEPMDAIPGGVIGREGLRTGPPRENGGNIDIKQAGIGSRMSFPVLVDGAMFSTGDAHFAQGDGEVCGAAIEMRSHATLRFTIRPGQARAAKQSNPRYTFYEPVTPAPREYIATTGISVDASGRNIAEDTTVAAKNALLDMISYLQDRGLTDQQAYALCSVAADLRLSEIVNGPNVLVSAVLPLDIFDE